LSDPNRDDGESNILKALSMGALDVIEKPTLDQRLTYAGASNQRLPSSKAKGSPLVETVRLLSRVKVVTHLAGKFQNPTNRQHSSLAIHRSSPARHGSLKVVAIAASTGGPSALAKILGGLPLGLKMCVVIVQHVAQGFSAGLAEWLDRESEMTVREARDGDRMRAGYAFLAPTGSHMVVNSGNRIMLDGAPPVAGHRPSADILLVSVARVYGHNSIGVILTGMGSDGAKGIVAIKNAGGKAIVQDEQSCVVFGMPKAAVQTGVVDEVLPLDSIAKRLCGFASMAHTLGGH
jgi:two-component system chemotaxis response regulator CheB